MENMGILRRKEKRYMEKNMSRSPYDYYPTPEWCYENLPIDWSQFKTAMEPCEGDCRITKFLQNKGIEVYTCEIQHDKDFFDYGQCFTEWFFYRWWITCFINNFFKNISIKNFKLY